MQRSQTDSDRQIFHCRETPGTIKSELEVRTFLLRILLSWVTPNSKQLFGYKASVGNLS